MSRFNSKLSVFVLAAAVMLGLRAASVNPSGYIYLNADDPSSSSASFNAHKGRWYDDGQPIASGTTMDATRNYLVQATSGYRVLRVSGNNTFPGASLTLDGGELRCSGGNPFTVNNLIVYKGRIQCASTGQIKCAGSLHLQVGGQLNLAGAMKRYLGVTAAIEGDSTTKIVVEASENVNNGTGTTLPYWVASLTGDNSAFTGSIAVKCLTTGGKYPTALVAGSGSSLGSSCAMTFDSRAALLGDGLVLNDARTITVGDEFTIGASTANGLTLGGGATVKGTGSSVVYVTNCVASAVTTLKNVAFDGVAKLVVLNGSVHFAADFNNPSLAVEIASGAKFTAAEGSVLGSIQSAKPNGYLSVVYPTVDRAALNRSNTGFAYALVSATSLNVNDFDLYNGVTREYFIVENNAQGVPTLYWKRDASDYDVYCMAVSEDANGYATDASWSKDGGVTKVRSTNPGDYIVESGKIVRQRSTNNKNFPGHMLSILGGGDLSVYDTTANTADLHLFESSIAKVRGTSKGTIAGQATIRSSELGFVEFAPENGTLTLSATLVGSGNVKYSANGTGTAGTINVTGDNSALLGKVALSSTKVTVRFKNEAAIGGNPRKFAPDGLSLENGVTLWCTADYQPNVTQPNRGVTLNGAVTVDVAANQTCSLGTPVAGAGSIVKKSAGTLALGAANTFSGGVTVNAGTLALGNVEALAGGNVKLADGTTLRLDCAGIKVGGAIPFATADGSAAASTVNLVVPDAAAEDFRIQELFVLTGVQDFDCTKFVLPNAGQFKFVKTLESDGLHVSLKKIFGLVVIVE